MPSHVLIGPSSQLELAPIIPRPGGSVVTQSSKAAEGMSREGLLELLAERDRGLAQAYEQQAALAEILDIINRQAGDAQPVFEKLLEKATRLCEAKFGIMNLLSDGMIRQAAFYNVPPLYTTRWRDRPYRPHPESVMGTVARQRQPIYVDDLRTRPAYLAGDPAVVDLSDLAGARSYIGVPMLRDDELIGMMSIFHQEIRPFAEHQVLLVKNFAQYAVTAVYNAQLFAQVQTRSRELQAKTRDLEESLQQQTATADVLKVISSSPGELEPVFQALLENAVRLCEAEFGMLFLPEENEFRAVGKWNLPPAYSEFLRKNTIRADPRIPLSRAVITKRPVQVADILVDQSYIVRHPGIVAVAEDGGARTLLQVPMLKENELVGTIGIYRQEVRPFSDKQITLVQNFAAQAVIAIENASLLSELRQRTDDLTRSLNDLRTAQDRLIQTEKLASLGQLTAGIAHEIKNPLNFVNNFSALSAELIGEMNDVLAGATLDKKTRGELDELAQTLRGNLEKIVQHGKRADSIVKNMLQHSREGSGEHRPADINAIVDESLNLAYHGARAEKAGFSIAFQRDLDPSVGMADVYPQEITRVLLNLISNGFYATTKRRAEVGDGFEPMLSAATRNLGDKVEIRIRDNGIGIPEGVKEKIFDPFFTTKPSGEGTGLGLSMSHDIIVKQHGGSIDVETEPGVFTEFKIILPRTSQI
jgi:two-component system, NtrC family, sensor kinase